MTKTVKEHSEFIGGYTTEARALAVARKLGGTACLWTPGAWVVIAPVSGGQEIRGPGWHQRVLVRLPKTNAVTCDAE